MTLQLESEERVGFVMRFGAMMARAREDAAMDAVRKSMGGD